MAERDARQPRGFRIGSEIRLTGVKRIVAEKMKQSYLEAPHIHLELSVDMTEATKIRDQLNRPEPGEPHFTFTDLIVKAVALCLVENPLLNATLRGDTILLITDLNIGIAVATASGLIVPVIKNVETLGLNEIARQRAQLVERAKVGRQTIEDISGGTFTVTNLGMFGIRSFRPILYPGQSGILAVGMISDTIVASAQGTFQTRPLMNASLACDHRIADGSDAAVFLSALKHRLEEPAALVEQESR
jgi:pyruvate dehydrogenase E2 component (dihydrolipoamide acetyltransferase)